MLGKPVGILTATFLTSKLTGRSLQKGLTWPDLTGVALLGGVGFTVSLLIGELAFGGNSAADDHVKIAVLTGSVTAALLAAVLLRMRNRRYRVMCEEEARDADNDGIPDVVLVDQLMPVMSGTDATRLLLAGQPDIGGDARPGVRGRTADSVRPRSGVYLPPPRPEHAGRGNFRVIVREGITATLDQPCPDGRA